jgi:hypothetical protein|tara:strand:+ start:1432 stop:2325 length:894 start_codon:yes stop_codon:yes gene_type:complete
MEKIFNILFLFLAMNIYGQDMAFIYGGGDVCNNAETIDVEISLFGTAPWNVVYAVDGINQPPISTSSNPHVISTNTAGIYTLTTVSDAIGVGTTSGSAIVTVLQAPVAKFNALPDTMSALYSTTQFVDQTNGAVSWSWNFRDNTPIDNTQNPEHTFPIDSNGFGILNIYQVSLIVFDANGCSDTTFKQVLVTDEYYIYIPSSFTPDLDSHNDRFCLNYHAIRENTFDFRVYDMNGEEVFSTRNIKSLECSSDKTKGWNGTHIRSGKALPIGNYVYEVYFQDFEGWKHHDFGFIHLVR